MADPEGIAPARVYALAFTSEGEILLVGGPGDTPWWLPGGGLEEGESPENGLVRELDEEAGATVDEFELLGYRRVDDPLDGRHHIATYWCRVTLPEFFVPRFEVTLKLLVRPDEFLDHLFWADDPAAAHLLRLAVEVDVRRR